jgi:hypothetical protein
MVNIINQQYLRLTLVQLLFVGTLGCFPFNDQTLPSVGSNLIPASSENNITSFSSC